MVSSQTPAFAYLRTEVVGAAPSSCARRLWALPAREQQDTHFTLGLDCRADGASRAAEIAAGRGKTGRRTGRRAGPSLIKVRAAAQRSTAQAQLSPPSTTHCEAVASHQDQGQGLSTRSAGAGPAPLPEGVLFALACSTRLSSPSSRPRHLAAACTTTSLSLANCCASRYASCAPPQSQAPRCESRKPLAIGHRRIGQRQASPKALHPHFGNFTTSEPHEHSSLTHFCKNRATIPVQFASVTVPSRPCSSSISPRSCMKMNPGRPSEKT